MVASEAHSITLAVEGLLGVVFTVATLTDEALDSGEVFTILFVHSNILRAIELRVTFYVTKPCLLD